MFIAFSTLMGVLSVVGQTAAEPHFVKSNAAQTAGKSDDVQAGNAKPEMKRMSAVKDNNGQRTDKSKPEPAPKFVKSSANNVTAPETK